MVFAGSGASRKFDLSSASTATLSFHISAFDNGNDIWLVKASSDNGSNYTTIDTFNPIGGPLDVDVIERNETVSYNLENYIPLTNQVVVRVRIAQGFGQVGVQYVSVDDIKVQYSDGGGYDDPTCNWVNNDEFDNGTSDWSLFVQSGNAATWSVDNSSQLSGANSAYVNITSTSGLDWDIELNQGGLPIVSGTDYAFRFDARAVINRNISVAIQESVSPWTIFGSR